MPAVQSPDIVGFVLDTAYGDLPDPVVRTALRCCLDIAGVASGRRTDLSRIVVEHAVDFLAPGRAASDILFTGQTASPMGAALAGGMTIDSVDAHDGHSLTKGHAGAAVVPALHAFASAAHRGGRTLSGREFLTMLAVGYEVSLRAGICLHATAGDYHTSGAWNALGCAAIGARCLELTSEETRHALGIAEYHGPRSQMMRCIDHPTMLKDGSGWGAMCGVSAALLAGAGFSGAPAVTLEYPEARPFWEDLGTRWELLNQYFKPYPVCRWAQPAIAAVADLMQSHPLDHAAIAEVEVTTFHEALRLAGHAPRTTEEAQYAIAFPVAAFIVTGDLGVEQLVGDALKDADILALSRKIRIRESARYNERFPAERWADVRLTLASGDVIESAPTVPPGEADRPLTDRQIRRKFERICAPSLDARTTRRLHDAIMDLSDPGRPVTALLDLLRTPVQPPDFRRNKRH